LRAGETVPRLVQGAAHRGRGGVELALGQPQERQPGLRRLSPASRLAVRVLGLAKVAAQSVQLRLLVEGRADRRLVGRLGEPLARPSRLAERVGPGAAKLQNLGAMDEALATVEDQVRLVLAPAAQ